MKAGFIGVGTMGRHMAANLMKSGFSLVVHDMHKEAANAHVQVFDQVVPLGTHHRLEFFRAPGVPGLVLRADVRKTTSAQASVRPNRAHAMADA